MNNMNLDDLFQTAQNDGLTADTLDMVVNNLNGPTMAGAVGMPLDELESNDVTLAMNIIDMSGSMQPHAADLMRAYSDDYLATMAYSPAADDILVSTVLFDNNVSLLHGYVPLPDAPPLSAQNYTPRGGTALYDAVAGGLSNMVLYAQQLRQTGVSVSGIVMVYTDGEDNASKQRAAEVKRAAKELLKQELYTLVYVGFGYKQPLGFKKTAVSPSLTKAADDIGFPTALAAGLNPAELSRIFRFASLSAVQVSQGGSLVNMP